MRWTAYSTATASPAPWPDCKRLLTTALLFVNAAKAIDMDVNSEQSVTSAASDTIYGMMTYYHGNETGQIPGAFPTKWWEGSALMLALIQYWHFTGDATYNDELSVGLQWQSGSKGDYMPTNYSAFLGNDDQMFWGVAAMTAAELKLPDRPTGFSWLSLAQGVYNTQVARWDTTTCGGGLRWQLYPYQPGYKLKNSISNGGLFQLAARLYAYSGNEKYLDEANKIWDWVTQSPLVNTTNWNIADSTDMPGCTNQGNAQWSYNYGTFLMGAAYLYNHTQGDTQAKWKTVVDGVLGVLLDKFFPTSNGGIFEEISCEQANQCNFNELLFKGVTSSWLSFTALLVPYTFNQIMPKIEASAAAAAKSCSGQNDNACGARWYQNKWDGTLGMEQQISSSDVLIASLARFHQSGPVTSTTGGNSTSDPNAGGKDAGPDPNAPKPMTTGDKVGAGFLTFVILGSWTLGLAWLVLKP